LTVKTASNSSWDGRILPFSQDTNLHWYQSNGVCILLTYSTVSQQSNTVSPFIECPVTRKSSVQSADYGPIHGDLLTVRCAERVAQHTTKDSCIVGTNVRTAWSFNW
jgi:hypothetical protein